MVHAGNAALHNGKIALYGVRLYVAANVLIDAMIDGLVPGKLATNASAAITGMMASTPIAFRSAARASHSSSVSSWLVSSSSTSGAVLRRTCAWS
jgi:hypothetical protein